MPLRVKSLTSLSLAILLSSTALAPAGTILEFIGSAGDGFVFVDPAENVVEPGIAIVTGAPNAGFIGNGFSPSGVVNCLRSSVPGAGCAEGPGAGNRIKTRLTGMSPLDLRFSVQPSGGITEYFTFGKTSNLTGARMLGFRVEIGVGTGADFRRIDPAEGVLMDELLPVINPNALSWPGLGGATEAQTPLQRMWLPDGLFGRGGQEGSIGFFDDQRAAFVLLSEADLTALFTNGLVNATHTALFGDGLLDNSMIPDGMFWDDNGDPSDESALVAWFSPAAGGWVYGNLSVDDPMTPQNELDDRLAELATSLGVSVADLGYTPGGTVPAAIVALMEGDPIFAVAPIEDLRNMNINMSLDVGDIVMGEFTVRLVPLFAPIVMEAATPFQFRVAGNLDAANVPYLGVDPAYLGVIAEVMALPTAAERQAALESLGFSFLNGFAGLSQALSNEAIFAAGRGRPAGDIRDEVAPGMDLFVSLTGGRGEVPRSVNGIGFDYQTYGVMAGMERRLSFGSLGVMVGFQDARADIDAGRGSMEAQSGTIAAFGLVEFGQGGRLRGLAGYQSLSFDTRRNIQFGSISETARGSTDGNTVFASLEAEWMFQRGATRFGPMASMEYSRTSIDGFTETGAGILNLTVDGQSIQTTVGRVGLGAEHRIARSDGTELQLTGYLGYARHNNDAREVMTGFAGSGLPMFPTPVDGMSRNAVELNLGVASTLSSGAGGLTRVGGQYSGSFSSGANAHRVRVFLEMTF